MLNFNSSVPHFRATFTLGSTNTLAITDLITSGYTSYGSTIKALFSITDPDGLLFYQNPGYATDDFSSPNIYSTTGTWTFSAGSLPLDADGVTAKRGTYTITAKYKCDSATYVTVSKSYNLQYVSPTVEISYDLSCRTSELTISDLTDYSSIGTDIVPLTTTISRSETTTKPAGSSANAPGTTTTTTATYSRTIGGGVTSATRLWTRVWQTNITTTLQFDIAYWDSYVWIVIVDTVYGDDNIDVRCSDSVCDLNTCWQNLVARWDEAEKNHAINVFDLRYKVEKGSALWTEFYNMERCGEDTSYKIIEIRDLLASEDCSCSGTTDDRSVVIVPWGSGAASPVASTFAFTSGTADPTPGSGTAGDKYVNTATGYLWDNIAGTWTAVLLLTGASGSAGTDATPQVNFYNNNSNTGTSAGTTLELLDSKALASPIAYTTGDTIYVKAVFELATANDNGKECSLYVNATKIVSYFTDSSVNADNKFVTLEMWVNVTGTNTQSIETLATRGGNCFPGYTTGTFDTSSTVTIAAYGQNTVATLNDIICRTLKVEYKKAI